MRESDLLEEVRVEPGQEEFPGYKGQRIECAECGEATSFERQVIRNGRALCRSCAGDRWYTPLNKPL
jgi:formylmethanofuran dehydrogenase subunit E